MNIDPRADTVRRTVGRRTLDTGEAAVVTVSQTYRTTAEDLWDACTDRDRLPRWFLPVSGDLAVGGRYRLEGNASGEILSCHPPRSFTATWEFGGKTSWIEVSVVAEPGGYARLEISHIAPADDEHWQRYGPGAAGIGWDQALLGLGLHLDTGEPVDPAAFAAWSTSPDGLRFVADSGHGWYDADVAGGTDAAVARERAERTVAFYTGA